MRIADSNKCAQRILHLSLPNAVQLQLQAIVHAPTNPAIVLYTETRQSSQ